MHTCFLCNFKYVLETLYKYEHFSLASWQFNHKLARHFLQTYHVWETNLKIWQNMKSKRTLIINQFVWKAVLSDTAVSRRIHGMWGGYRTPKILGLPRSSMTVILPINSKCRVNSLPVVFQLSSSPIIKSSEILKFSLLK